jgi:hypothetical protein
MTMRTAYSFLALLGFFILARDAFAIPASELKENYQPIIDRNPFGLKPPPPPPTNNTANLKETKPKVEVFLTGITSIGYPTFPKQAYFMTKEQAGKQTETNYYALSEGFEKDGLKVLNIDLAQKKVRIVMDDTESLIGFDTHGLTNTTPLIASGAKPGQPGAAPAPMPGVERPAQGQPNNGTVAPNAPVPRQIPYRRVRGMESGATSMQYNTGTPPPLTANSTVNGGLAAGANGGIQQQPQVQVDPAEQYLRMHLERAAQVKQGIPMPPLPIISQ